MMKKYRQLFFTFLYIIFISASILSAETGERWALVIGADEYQAMGKLDYCGSDARALAEVLQNYLGFEGVKLVTDREISPGNRPTLAAIQRHIINISELARPQDMILIFFSGHGIIKEENGYLVPVDGDAKHAISMSWVKNTIQQSNARHKILIIDACHAGSGSKGISGIVPSLASQDLIMLMSSAEGQESYPNAEGTNSIFTEKLLKGLRGEAADENQLVTIPKLFEYISNELRRWSFLESKRQEPQIYPSQVSDIVLGTVQPQRGTVRIEVIPETGPWRLLGPESYTRVGGGTETITDLQPGIYRITFDELTGYETPKMQIRNLQYGKTLLFPGIWIPLVSKGENFPLELDNNIRLEMVWVEGGTFMMGADDSDAYDDEKPVHEVSVDSFWMGKYEITVGVFDQFVKETGYITEAEKEEGASIWTKIEGEWQWKNDPEVNWRNPGFPQGANQPVTCVSWNDAQEFIGWINRKNSKQELVFRLPTEAEWEYAARGGRKSEGYKYAGSNDLNVVGWYAKNSSVDSLDPGRRTHPVGQKAPNELGLYDMSGNVWEWVQDWYEADYYSSDPESNPGEPVSGSERVRRGGSWSNGMRFCRSAIRVANPPDISRNNNGFRILAVEK